jgi:threonine dehydrogenase-like Zn-dependent dehydrogenase
VVAGCASETNPAGDQLVQGDGLHQAGLFSYSHSYGGFAGGQAEHLRVPYANVGTIKVPMG